MTNHIQWEYCQLSGNGIFFYRTQERTSITPDFEGHTKAITQLGLDGWELVTIDPNGGYYFKRSL